MSWVQDIADLVSKLSFFQIVHIYQQGLYMRRGMPIEKPVKWRGEDLEKILAEEKKVTKEKGEKLALMLQTFFRKKPQFPQCYRTSWLGLPLHPKRFEKDYVLRPGVYFNVPVLDEIIVRSKQIKPLDCGNVLVPSTDEESKSVLVSCNLRYNVLNLYKAYIIVDDYEESLKIHALSILAEHSRGKSYKEWKSPESIKNLERDVLKDLREVVTDDWGLKIHDIHITYNVECRVIVHEGPVAKINRVEILQAA